MSGHRHHNDLPPLVLRGRAARGRRGRAATEPGQGWALASQGWPTPRDPWARPPPTPPSPPKSPLPASIPTSAVREGVSWAAIARGAPGRAEERSGTQDAESTTEPSRATVEYEEPAQIASEPCGVEEQIDNHGPEAEASTRQVANAAPAEARSHNPPAMSLGPSTYVAPPPLQYAVHHDHPRYHHAPYQPGSHVPWMPTRNYWPPTRNDWPPPHIRPDFPTPVLALAQPVEDHISRWRGDHERSMSFEDDDKWLREDVFGTDRHMAV